MTDSTGRTFTIDSIQMNTPRIGNVISISNFGEKASLNNDSLRPHYDALELRFVSPQNTMVFLQHKAWLEAYFCVIG